MILAARLFGALAAAGASMLACAVYTALGPGVIEQRILLAGMAAPVLLACGLAAAFMTRRPRLLLAIVVIGGVLCAAAIHLGERA